MNPYLIEICFEATVTELDDARIIPVITKILEEHRISACEITTIFVGNEYIIQLNTDFFNKPQPTDVISFPLSEPDATPLEGEIYVAAEVAREQAAEYHVSVANEMLRLVIHGALHLLGYLDGTVIEKAQMTEKEDYYLNLFQDERLP